MSEPAAVVPGLPADAGALLDAVVAIGSDLDLHSVLRRITESSCALTGARYGFLAILGEEGEILDFVTHGMSEHQMLSIARLPEAAGLLGEITTAARPVRLGDLSAHPTAAGFPKNHPPMSTFLGVPVRVRGKVFGNLYLTEKQGGAEFTAADELLVEALAGAAGYVVENARAYALSEVRRKWLEATSALTERLQATDDIDEVLALVVAGVRNACNGLTAALVVPAGESHVTIAADGAPDDDVAVMVGAVASELAAFPPNGPVRSLPHGSQGTVALAPMRAMLADHAMLVVWLPHGRGSLEPGTAELLTTFADHASLAFDRAEAVADRDELMLIADRERIARDLHDVVIQRIFATGLQLQGLRRRLTDTAVQSQLDDAMSDLDATIRDIRATIFELNQRGRESLRGSLISLVAEYSSLLGYRPSLRTAGPLDTIVPDEIAHDVLSVVREALSNVAKHATGATWCEVRIDAEPDRVLLSVSDDGCGLPEQRVESGLRNVGARAARLGGTMSVETNSPRGTVVRWQAPYDR